MMMKYKEKEHRKKMKQKVEMRTKKVNGISK
jgi:hypothetical protein